MIQSGFTQDACLTKDNKFDEAKVEIEINKILKRNYVDSIEKIHENYDKVEKVAALLIKEKKIPGKKVYEICGVERPKYDFEQPGFGS